MLNKAIIELWHISLTALATHDNSRHSRMLYIKNELLKSYPNLVKGMSGKQIWFAIEEEIN